MRVFDALWGRHTAGPETQNCENNPMQRKEPFAKKEKFTGMGHPKNYR